MGLLKDIIARSIRSAFCRLVPKPWMRVRQVTEAFATHYNWQRPLKADRLWQSTSSDSLS
jgi:hypothetical protein